ncbi:hypothetical protein CW733_02520 [Lacinutrix sp. Bg11-31]|nr:hypothetical protein CW733_02520 [Lacinutrix sp. Bg11-31]
MKIRLGFTSVKNIHRQLLVTADTNATSGIGFCYNANSFENHPYNMYWTISDRLFLIQGIDIINEYSILALGLDISTAAVSTK